MPAHGRHSRHGAVLKSFLRGLKVRYAACTGPTRGTAQSAPTATDRVADHTKEQELVMHTTAAATPATTTGIVVSTALTAGRLITGNHTEGILVTTDIAAGRGGSDIIIGNHAEGILVATAITAGGGIKDGTSLNHVEGVVVSTSLNAGGISNNHAEGNVAV
jgi:hypothetical protein